MTQELDRSPTAEARAHADRLLERARWLVDQPAFGATDPCADLNPSQTMSMKGFAPGFMGFDDTGPGDRILLATTNLDAENVTRAMVEALRERGATVDVIVTDIGADRPLQEDDEYIAAIRREHWSSLSADQRRHYAVPWVTERFQTGGYDLLVQGRAAPFGPWRWEGHPWTSDEIFLSEAVTFPRDLHVLINEKSWAPVWQEGKGARVRVRDPEGTDISWTLLPEFWEKDQSGFSETPLWNHLMYHPIPPVSASSDVTGVVSGTTAHFGKPFPQITLEVVNGKVESIAGGGEYGERLRALAEETKDLQYPDFPGTGILWMWEAALGTNPKVARPTRPTMMSSGGTEWERWRAGALHFGFGTCGPSDQEAWAAEQGLPYGHIHVHQFFPTIEMTTADGRTIVTCDKGRLAAFDDSEVRECARSYGDPEEVLAGLWTPPMPGVTLPGDIEVYLREPARWFGATT